MLPTRPIVFRGSGGRQYCTATSPESKPREYAEVRGPTASDSCPAPTGSLSHLQLSSSRCSDTSAAGCKGNGFQKENGGWLVPGSPPPHIPNNLDLLAQPTILFY
jgi:hypothetical protein